MAHPGPDEGAAAVGGIDPGRVAGASRRLGVALVWTAAPAVVAILAVALVGGEAAGRPLAWLAAAMATPLVGVTGLGWAFRVTALAGLVGVWLLGFALVVEGYFGGE